MIHRNIKLLELIPVELVEAENVKSVVIHGQTFNIKQVIGEAKHEARNLLESKQFIFTAYTAEQLQNILNFY